MQIQNISAYERRDEDIFTMKGMRKSKLIYEQGLVSIKLSSIYVSIIIIIYNIN